MVIHSGLRAAFLFPKLANYSFRLNLNEGLYPLLDFRLLGFKLIHYRNLVSAEIKIGLNWRPSQGRGLGE